MLNVNKLSALSTNRIPGTGKITYVNKKNKKPVGRRISQVFEELRKNNKKAFIPFVSCGYPDMNRYFQLVDILIEGGADILEVGIPFSDPLADGPIIQTTSKIALENGVNTDVVFDSVSTIREKSSIPVVILSYFNNVYKYGVERFLHNARKKGVDALIIPDLPLEEFYSYEHIFRKADIDNIMLASLTSSRDRLVKISDVSRGFIYCVSVKGVTGVRNNISDEVKDFLKKLKSITNIPLALGFGLSNRGQIEEIKDLCDGIIIGSKLLSILLEKDSFENNLQRVEKFVLSVNTILKG